MTPLKNKEWAEFDFMFIFPKIQRGRRLKNADHIDGTIPYISSSAMNNGVDDFVSNDKGVRRFTNCITLANSGSVGKAFYHDYSFVASDHVTALQSPQLNKYSYLFISTMVERLQGKYSFNREINDARINREKIMLPIDEHGTPDWAYMEEYGRYLFTKLKLQYLQHKQIISI